MTIHVYAGPTLSTRDVRRHRPDAVVHPPVAHGDLLRVPFEAGDVVVIVDGFFHHAAPVRHKEILALLARSVRVVGCSSIGALRAAELHPYGMSGWGTVFRMYRDGVVDADDEVAVAHTEAPDYRRLSEPLVNIRHVVSAAVGSNLLAPEVARSLVATAAGLHYTRRSWRAVEEAELRRRPERRADLRRLSAFRAASPGAADVKVADAVDTLRHLDRIVGAPPPGSSAEWAVSQDWRSRYLYAWQATFAGTHVVDGVPVGPADVLRHQQAYHPDFPRRWRRFVLDRVEPGAGPSVPDGAARHWLTAAERAGLPAAEQARRALVRSYRPPRPLYDLVTAFPDLLGDPAARRAVAESAAVNAEVASWRPRSGPEHLRRSLLTGHLAETWGVDPIDGAGLDTAARDRGLGSAAEAVEAVRPFFLRRHIRDRPPAVPGPGRD